MHRNNVMFKRSSFYNRGGRFRHDTPAHNWGRRSSSYGRWGGGGGGGRRGDRFLKKSVAELDRELEVVVVQIKSCSIGRNNGQKQLFHKMTF